MPFCVRALALPQIRALYAERLSVDFPPDELKPLSAIEQAFARSAYACYGAVDGDRTLAYAFFVKLNEHGRRLALFDYFAVDRMLRGQGVGGRFLQALIAGPLRDLSCVLLEVDEPACAASPEDQETCLRRLRFYLRNGLTDTSVTATVYGVTYRILALPVGTVPDPAETRRVYAALYRSVMPARIFSSKVIIH